MPLLIRYLDLVALVAALPIFILAGFSMVGYLAATVGWFAQRLLERFLQKQADATDDPRRIVGLTAGGAIARGWLVAFTIMGIGIANKEAGLSAAVLIMAVFTVYFIVGLMTHSTQEGDSKS